MPGTQQKILSLQVLQGLGFRVHINSPEPTIFRVPMSSTSGFITRTCEKVGFVRLR